MKILVISPHSDDAELGCGGYIAKCVAEGHTVSVLTIMTKDDLTSSKGLVPAKRREHEFRKSMSILGVRQADTAILLKDMSDDFDLCLFPQTDMISDLDARIQEFRPDQVFIPMPSFHQEHEWVHKVSIAATRPTVSSSIKNVYAYEYPASGWSSNPNYLGMTGRVFADISDLIDLKIMALKCHTSQNMTDGGLVSTRGMMDLAQWRGREHGVEFAEMFYLLRGSL